LRKGDGQESRLAYLGHALMENRNGLVVGAEATLGPEREAAAAFREGLPEGATLGAGKNNDAEAFVEGLKARGIEPHVAINGAVSKTGKVRKTAVPPDVAASAGYVVSQRLRKRIEEGFGWSKTVGGLNATEGARTGQSPRRLRLHRRGLQHRAPAQIDRTQGRTASGELKNTGMRSQQNRHPVPLAAERPKKPQPPPASRQRGGFFSSPLVWRRLRLYYSSCVV
jgi:hypothetical protein